MIRVYVIGCSAALTVVIALTSPLVVPPWKHRNFIMTETSEEAVKCPTMQSKRVTLKSCIERIISKRRPFVLRNLVYRGVELNGFSAAFLGWYFFARFERKRVLQSCGKGSNETVMHTLIGRMTTYTI